MKMKVKLFKIFLLLFLITTCKNDSTEKPNIIIFLSDDQGWGDLNLNGNPNLNTPNIDGIGANGAIFERFYVSPVCSPTRAELLTGKYFVRSGVRGVTQGYERIDLGHTLMSDFFKDNEYKTGLFGKWHNGSQPPYHPNTRGFDEFYGFTSGHWGNYFSPILERNSKIVRGKGYISDDITNKAITFIKNSKDPFFTFISFNTPHSPMQVPSSYLENKKVIKQGRYKDKENVLKTKAALSMVENLDYNVGRVLDSLKKYKKYENTIVIFFSDNGPNGYRWNNDLKGRKGSTDEGGVRVPFLIQWPIGIKKSIKVNQITSVMDVFPSLIELANLKSEIKFDGESFVKNINNPKTLDDNRKIFSYWGNKISIRNNNFILDSNDNLYNLNSDLEQLYPLDSFSSIYTELKSAKRKWEDSFVINYQKKKNKRAFTVNFSEQIDTHLPARDAKINGKLKRSSIHPNDSFIENWIDMDDYILWEIDVMEKSSAEVELYYTLPEESIGTKIAIEYQNEFYEKVLNEPYDSELFGQDYDIIVRSESYNKEFKKINMGKIKFDKGKSILKLKTLDKVGKKSIDFRLLIIKKTS